MMWGMSASHDWNVVPGDDAYLAFAFGSVAETEDLTCEIRTVRDPDADVDYNQLIAVADDIAVTGSNAVAFLSAATTTGWGGQRLFWTLRRNTITLFSGEVVFERDQHDHSYNTAVAAFGGGVISSDGSIIDIVAMTRAAFDAIAEPSPKTYYLIVG